jgi:hypothetical protein
MKLTVFTVILGQTDPLIRPTVVNKTVRYVCLSDRPQTIAPYVSVLVDPAELGVKLMSRQLKILADHPSLGAPDVVLWHDAAFRMDCDPVRLAAEALTEGMEMLAFKHPHRTQIEDEADAIARYGWVPREQVERQVATYRAEGFRQAMITSTGFCLRRLTPAIVAFNRFWWGEVAKWGWRDQLSVDYAIWRTGVRLRYIPGHYRDNPYARWHWYPPPRRRAPTPRPPLRRPPVIGRLA